MQRHLLLLREGALAAARLRAGPMFLKVPATGSMGTVAGTLRARTRRVPGAGAGSGQEVAGASTPAGELRPAYRIAMRSTRAHSPAAAEGRNVSS